MTANDRFYADYQAGTLDIDAFLAYQLAPPPPAASTNPPNSANLATWRGFS